jgi:hypothetical protein
LIGVKRLGADPALLEAVDALPRLPAALKAGILAMIQAVKGGA